MLVILALSLSPPPSLLGGVVIVVVVYCLALRAQKMKSCHLLWLKRAPGAALVDNNSGKRVLSAGWLERCGVELQLLSELRDYMMI